MTTSNRSFWSEKALPLFLSLLFLFSGATKLAGMAFQLEDFAGWGFPAWWFLYAVGGAEVVGAALLFSSKTRVGGAIFLSVMMLGAISTHLRVGEFLLLPGPVFLLGLLGLVLARTQKYLRTSSGEEGP